MIRVYIGVARRKIKSRQFFLPSAVLPSLPLEVGPLTLSQPIPLRLYTLPYWSNAPFFMSYGADPFKQQQFGAAGVERVNPAIGVC